MKLVTINLAGLEYGWFDGRRDVLIEQLKQLDPDVVFLQETTVLPEKSYDQTRDLKDSLGLIFSSFAPYGNSREFESPRPRGVGIH